jgi:hypothetical protein
MDARRSATRARANGSVSQCVNLEFPGELHPSMLVTLLDALRSPWGGGKTRLAGQGQTFRLLRLMCVDSPWRPKDR